MGKDVIFKDSANADSSDSDSSDNDGSSVDSAIGSGVTLGFADDGPPISLSKQCLLDATTNKLGGYPVFHPILTNAPNIAHSECHHCKESMPLICQIFAPMSEGITQDWSRALYVWACISKDCQSQRSHHNSVRCFRALRKPMLQSKTQSVVAASAPSNPFSVSSSSTSNTNTYDFGFDQDSLSSLSIQDSFSSSSEGHEEIRDVEPVQWPSAASFRLNLPALYLSTCDEPSSFASHHPPSSSSSPSKPDNADGFRTVTTTKKKQSPSSNSNTVTGGGDNWSGEKYEKQLLDGLDEVFLRFQDRVVVKGKGEYSDQVIRYQAGSQSRPLPFIGQGSSYDLLYPIIKSKSKSNIPSSASSSSGEGTTRQYTTDGLEKCEFCGGKRNFELQLMPQLVTVLSKDGILKNHDDTYEIGWSTVFVFTCENDCFDENEESSWREELVLLQYE